MAERNTESTAFGAERQAEPKWFLADHGEFYAKEIANGLVFIPEHRSAERKVVETVAPGDLFFHRSPSGISAIGRAVSAFYRALFPLWRKREGDIGERGYVVEVEIFLLPATVPIPKTQVSLAALSKAKVEAIFERIFEQMPEIANAEWIRRFCRESRIRQEKT